MGGSLHSRLREVRVALSSQICQHLAAVLILADVIDTHCNINIYSSRHISLLAIAHTLYIVGDSPESTTALQFLAFTIHCSG